LFVNSVPPSPTKSDHTDTSCQSEAYDMADRILGVDSSASTAAVEEDAKSLPPVKLINFRYFHVDFHPFSCVVCEYNNIETLKQSKKKQIACARPALMRN